MSITAEKLNETHFEYFIREYRKLLNCSPLEYVDQIIARFHKGTELSFADDTPYVASTVAIMNRLMFPKGEPEEGYWDFDKIQSKPAVLNQYRLLLNNLIHLHRFAKNRMVFRMEEGLTAKLLHTELKEVDSTFIESPFETIYLDVPHNRKLFLPIVNGSQCRIRGFYISFAREVDVTGVRLVASSEKEFDADGIHPDLKWNGVPATKMMRIMAVAEGYPGAKPGLVEDKSFFMSTFLAPGDVFPQIERIVNKYNDGNLDKSNALREMVSFCINALLYITSPSADLKKIKAKFVPKSKKASDMKNRGISKIDVVSTGSSVYISSGFRQQYREGTLSEVVSKNTPYWLVRGHYRKQACGEGRQERKLIWIEPFTKGKGVISEGTDREYKVKE